MTGLQARVLAVVAERQELSCVVVEVGLASEGSDDRLREHRDRAGAAFGAKAGDAGELGLAGALVARLARRAEVEPLEERHRHPVVGDGAELVDT